MKKMTKYAAKQTGLIGGIAAGVAVSLMVWILGASILAWLITAEKVTEEAVRWGRYLILFLSSCAGVMTAWMRVKENRLMVWLAYTGAAFGVLLMGALLLGDGVEGALASGMTILLGGGILFIPVMIGSKNGGRKYKFKGFR